MKEGPNFAAIAALLGDPARANILTALMRAQALTASELAQEAGVALSTASGHLSKLEGARLVTRRKQGRHSYFQLSDADVATVLEGLMGLAARTGHRRTRPGPTDPALRAARVCYDHLAGDAGVRLYDRLVANGLVNDAASGPAVTPRGARLLSDQGFDLGVLSSGRRPLCRACLDWSERRRHLGGALGAALLKHMLELKWARRLPNSRAVVFSRRGLVRFDEFLA
jgi:DNA-binding transcriptional ArsR family regulator